jgi:ferrous iron transport protein B
MYIKKAGTFIAFAAFGVWVLSSFPRAEIVKKYEPLIKNAKNKQELVFKMNKEILENSYLAKIAKTINPVFKPLGFTWKETTSIISGLAAKEVIVSTMAVLYSNGTKNSKDLIHTIQKQIPFYVAVAMIIFVMFYSPCLAAMSTFWAEVPQWQWRIFYTVYPNVFAYIAALLAVWFLK